MAQKKKMSPKTIEKSKFALIAFVVVSVIWVLCCDGDKSSTYFQSCQDFQSRTYKCADEFKKYEQYNWRINKQSNTVTKWVSGDYAALNAQLSNEWCAIIDVNNWRCITSDKYRNSQDICINGKCYFDIDANNAPKEINNPEKRQIGYLEYLWNTTLNFKK